MRLRFLVFAFVCALARPASAELLTFHFTAVDAGHQVTYGTLTTEYQYPGLHEFTRPIGTLMDVEALFTELRGDPNDVASWWFSGPWFDDAFPYTNTLNVSLEDFPPIPIPEPFYGNVYTAWTKSWDGIDYFNGGELELITVLEGDRWQRKEGTYGRFGDSVVTSLVRVPEPGTLLLTAIGFCAAGGRRRPSSGDTR